MTRARPVLCFSSTMILQQQLFVTMGLTWQPASRSGCLPCRWATTSFSKARHSVVPHDEVKVDRVVAHVFDPALRHHGKRFPRNLSQHEKVQQTRNQKCEAVLGPSIPTPRAPLRLQIYGGAHVGLVVPHLVAMLRLVVPWAEIINLGKPDTPNTTQIRIQLTVTTTLSRSYS